MRAVVFAVVLVTAGCATGRQADIRRARERAVPEVFRVDATAEPGGEAAHAQAPASEAPGPSAGPRALLTFSLRVIGADGAVVSAPRISVLSGQRATMQIVEQYAYIEDVDVQPSGDGASFTADPIVGLLGTGVFVDLLGEAPAVPGGPVPTALSVRVARTTGRPREIPVVLAPSAAPCRVDAPFVESAESVVGRRIPQGREVEVATIQSPDGPLRILVECAAQPAGPDDTARADVEPTLPPSEGSSALAPLAAAAASGAPERRVVARAVVGASQRRELSRMEAVSVLAPGFRISRALEERYLRDQAPFGGGAAGVADPQFATHRSGVTLSGAEGDLVAEWSTTPSVGLFTTRLGPDSRGPVEIELPHVVSAAGRVPASGGALVLGRTRDGEAVLQIAVE